MCPNSRREAILHLLGKAPKTQQALRTSRSNSRAELRSQSRPPREQCPRPMPVRRSPPQTREEKGGGLRLASGYAAMSGSNGGRSSEVVGVESLVRWEHPEDGLIFPDRFIGLAEEHGLISEVTRTVLASAFKQAKTWLQGGHHLPVAVNVSVNDLTALDFPDVAAELATVAGIEPRVITLEVTEGRVMKELSTALDVLSRLRLKRFRLAIDDFGTGNSSLAQLRDLPFDELKVDRSFVHGASADGTLRAICNASLRMAHQLNMQVVAEGIEDRNDWDLLRQLGYDVGQGYFIARPMPAENLASWMADWDVRRRATNSLSG
jgi:EAL domain-containing protein (putative c-di-GMP-specific phosphodiesterase class I)